MTWWLLILVPALAAGYLLSRWPLINDVHTGRTRAYPDIQVQTFSLPAGTVFACAVATAQRLGWELIVTDPESGHIEAVATTSLLRFRDDVSIWIAAAGANESRVDVRSRSRLGRGDLGANARRIRAFQDLLERNLQARLGGAG